MDNPCYEAARNALVLFAELVKSPEHIHTYRISDLSLWNAAASGVSEETILSSLEEFSKYEIPAHIRQEIHTHLSRYGILTLHPFPDDSALLKLESKDPYVFIELARHKRFRPLIVAEEEGSYFLIRRDDRGNAKQVLTELGYPVEDLVGYVEGAPLAIELKSTTLLGKAFAVRDYQEEAAQLFWRSGAARGGSGVIVLPCGAGKTIMGMRAIALIKEQTLIITTNVTAARQWIRELLDKTTLSDDMIGEYSGNKKEIKPITIATYQILTYRKSKTAGFLHMGIFNENRWGLIIYDEVHLLPAPVFRATASIQSTRRLGLTATLIREDGKEKDVFSLIGPKRYDAPWKEMEKQCWIAAGTCVEFRLPLPSAPRLDYAISHPRRQFQIASQNPLKVKACEHLLKRHDGESILVIGHYLAQLRELSDYLATPLITGATPQLRREELYDQFRRGEVKVLVVSNVANFAVDLPDASVAVQVSGTYGSRQEEAQRLGRILRPKDRKFTFYTLVSKETCEQDFVMNRQLFLTEQGYDYQIEEWNGS